jgi:hypothetical protein
VNGMAKVIGNPKVTFPLDATYPEEKLDFIKQKVTELKNAVGLNTGNFTVLSPNENKEPSETVTHDLLGYSHK